MIDPDFECSTCQGTGIISYPVRFGKSIYHEYRDRLDFRAKLTERQSRRFIGFQEQKGK